MNGRLEKALGRFAEIANIKHRKVTEKELRLEDTLQALQDELIEENAKTRPDSAAIQYIQAKMVGIRRDLDFIRKRK